MRLHGADPGEIVLGHLGHGFREPPGAVQAAGLEIDAALAAGAGSVLLCHPANPVGRIYRPEELRQLAGLVTRHGARVISDEIHAPLRYQEDFTPYASVGDEAREHAVSLFSATKAWNIPGLRCGFIALPNAADQALWAVLPAAWLDQAVGCLAANRALLGRLLADAGLPDVYTPPEATYLAWLDLRGLGLPRPVGPAARTRRRGHHRRTRSRAGRHRLRPAQLRHPAGCPRRGRHTHHQGGGGPAARRPRRGSASQAVEVDR
ncbi:aminotransferase class I/II-fold pyridoxal phosphate-dependent enzyme [Streptomyces sp. S465]|uniref:aminotransferase class I/II-fold pyridoxal phosphate-dependent enzyme n=1 Tax=Streptomyces sp. S465 TaxID=2979468 RepID=UPI0022A8504F|nr:aminotransferase class I/II-fold pyridoxal phosphate-dependent enzyme [Streptomyces sp. S465]WAP53708.1 aminotransferase class I/II-fold pyridoxal phosphate-dependent enzyme [Streptomyces sp. S465]